MSLFSELMQARVLAVASVGLDILFQMRRLLQDSPRPFVAYGPHPYCDLLLFCINTLLDVVWIMGFFSRHLRDGDIPLHLPVGKVNEKSRSVSRETGFDADDDEQIDPEPTQFAFVPYKAAGSVLLALWNICWLSDILVACEIFLTNVLKSVESSCFVYKHLFAFYRAPKQFITPSKESPHTSRGESTNSHHCALSMEGRERVIQTWGVIAGNNLPSSAANVVAAMIFLSIALATAPDVILPLTLTYDALAMSFGSRVDWKPTFVWVTILLATVVVLETCLLWRLSMASMGWTGESPEETMFEVDRARGRSRVACTV
ncbi:hypothetical protein FISHEDRAFT_57321 [Fistulina hepatica ATCC 64428]|uniref:Uncharacterized protein n=1 Tax=Fistulina hepatica ATCC 64428 TaxID=1128425 RepID=A0A0D7AGR8_9AGAR|nr:hypothetical protein FISHEDRAFT_57321 [Fistulina hepatica ATCC 64428]